jgi:hypothetical protein
VNRLTRDARTISRDHAAGGSLDRLTNAELNARAAAAIEALEGANAQRRESLLGEIAALRHEMMGRISGEEPGDDGASGVREPRRPRPGGSAAAVAVDLPA